MPLLSDLLRSVQVPPHLKPFYGEFKSRPVRLLDVGCGAHAPTKAKRFLPGCEYHGIDFDDNGLDETDRAVIQRFYSVNLDTGTLAGVPDSYFDVIVLSHVIEHLHHGLEVIRTLTGKLRPGGQIYIEFPGVRSLNVPRARRGFLHFHDDPTHVRLYTIPEVVNVLLTSGCAIIRAGVRRDRVRLMLTPLLFARGILRGDPWSGRVWDAFGIAEVVLARKVG